VLPSVYVRETTCFHENSARITKHTSPQERYLSEDGVGDRTEDVMLLNTDLQTSQLSSVTMTQAEFGIY